MIKETSVGRLEVLGKLKALSKGKTLSKFKPQDITVTGLILLVLISLQPLKNLQASIDNNRASKDTNTASANTQRYIVQLQEPTLSRFVVQEQSVKNKQATAGSISKLNLRSATANTYRNNLRSKQNQFINTLRKVSPSVKVHHQYQSLLNGLAVTASQADIEALSQRTEIKNIFKDRLRYVHLDTSHDVINTPDAWEVVGGQSEAGKGIKIAIIDSGIRNDNPMFFDDGFEAPDLSSNTYLTENPDYCRAINGDPSFCNNKIIVARWVDPVAHEVFGLDANEYMSPLGLNRHGSHVAGIAAGNPVNIEYEGVQTTLSGVAPGSYLMVYKALYSSQGSTFGSDSMLLEALEHAVNDGADVINNSWGAYAGESPESSVYADVFANAEALGITIVNSAGNTGGISQGSINCPGCIESGITVANTMHGRFFANQITIGGESFVAVQGKNPSVEQNLSLPLRSFSELGPRMSDGCEYSFNTATFNHAAVLVDFRENCDMATVVNNVKLAGGEVAILYQSNVTDTQSKGPFTPYDVEFPIPVLGVSRSTGLTLFDKAHGGNTTVYITSQVSRVIDPSFANTLNNSSSTGPNANPNVLKPDLAAPGTNILSASAPLVDSGPFDPFDPFSTLELSLPGDGPTQSEPVFTLISGTSMSSPHIAGAAALIKQAHADWTTSDIKTAMTSTASEQVTFRSGNATPFEVGAGQVQLNAAINTKLTFAKASYANAACIGRCYFDNVLRNKSESEESWLVEVQLDNNAATWLVNGDNRITLTPEGQEGDAQQLNIEIDTTLVEPGTWVFGKVIFSHSSYASQHLPIAVFANNNSDKTALSTAASMSTPDANIQISTVVRNFDFTQDPNLTISLPDNVSFIDDSQQAIVSRGQTSLLQFDPLTHAVKWQGTLQHGSMQLLPVTPWENESLTSLNVAEIECSANCYNFSHVMDFDFEFNGRAYSTLTLSSNGIAIPGSPTVDPFSISSHQPLPLQDELNNVIAPLWANYAEYNSGADGGHLRTAIRDINNSRYLVAEWDSLSLFGSGEDGGDQNDVFSFQLIIEEHSDNIWFNYLAIPYLPHNASIGAENLEGLIGINYYFNGQGSQLPVPISLQSYTLKLETEPTGQATIQFDVKLANNQQSTTPDDIELDEDSSIDIDPLNNDSGTLAFKVESDLVAGTAYQVSRLVTVAPHSEMDSESLQISQAPQHGRASITDGNIQYTPDNNYHGPDTLVYRVANTYGHYSELTLVNIEVMPVNDAPQVTIQSTYQVSKGQQVTLSAKAEDADSTSLQYHWQQTGGIIVDYTQQDNQITFTAPDISENLPLTFSVTVSDSELQSSAAQTSVKVVSSKSGGSLYITNLMLIVMVLLHILSRKRMRLSRT